MAYENTTWYDDPNTHPEDKIYSHQLPDWSDPEGEPVTIKLVSSIPDYVTFNPITRIFTVNKQNIPEQQLKQDSFIIPMKIEMQDYYGTQKTLQTQHDNIVEYDFRITIIRYLNHPPSFAEPLL